MYDARKAVLMLTRMAVLCLASLPTAQAQIVSFIAPVPTIRPFVGNLSETWEGFAIGGLSSPTDIMGGAATISSPRMAIYDPTAGADYSLGESGNAQVSDGTKGMGLDPISYLLRTEILFDSPVDSFGAYWGMGTGSEHYTYSTLALKFFDVFDGEIGYGLFDYPLNHNRFYDGTLEWHGWSSTTPIKKITFFVSYGPIMDGFRAIVMDGLQAKNAQVPEPGALAFLGGLSVSGAAFLLRRKRLLKS